LPPDFAPESTRRSPPGAGEYLEAPEGRAFRQLPPPGEDAGKRDRPARGSRPKPALNAVPLPYRAGATRREPPGPDGRIRRRRSRARAPVVSRGPGFGGGNSGISLVVVVRGKQ